MDGKTRWVGFTGTQRTSKKKFFASALLQRFDFERALIDQMVPFDGTRTQLAQPRMT
jgi:hypothetical protein